MAELDLNALSDIQGNLLRGYNMSFAKYLFYRWETLTQGREWVTQLLPGVTISAPWSDGKKPGSALNVAFTHQGLNALGLSPNALASFPDEFKQGMAARAAILGDFGENDPAKWDKFLGSTNVHALVIIHATSEAVRQQAAADLEALRKRVGGVTCLFEEDAAGFDDHKEHFGFKDGISQPLIENADALFGVPPSPGGGKRTKAGDWAPLKAGEFILGYEDESGRLSSSPSPTALGMNGTYLVFRKLRQDVAGFRNYLMKAAKTVFGSTSPQNAERLGALMMGRWPSGCPVDLSSVTDNAAIGANNSLNNDFWFNKDPKGEKCPLGAHIRRTNPREGPDPDPQNPTPDAPEKGSNRHRLIRRGMPYGPKLIGEADDGKERGLFFLALNASIARQFEFLQGFWVNSGEFQGLDRTDRDPIIGGNKDNRDPKTDDPRKFTMPGTDKQFPVAFNLPEFVTMRGGDYFFAPSMTALNGLAQGAFTSFLSEYKALESMVSDPGKLAIARKTLVWSWLVGRAKEMFDELRVKQPIFHMPGYPALGVDTVFIVTKYEDVLEILRNDQVFSVRKYTEKMDTPRGPFILGMPDTRDPDPKKKKEQEAQYQRELSILQAVVPRGDLDNIIRPRVSKITDDILKGLKSKGKLDLIQDLIWPVLVRLNGDYFGVSGHDEETLKRWWRDIYKDMFLNLRGIPEWTQAADVAVQQMNEYLDGLIEGMITAGNTGPDTVLARLIKQLKNQDGSPDRASIRRNILGLTVGVVETNLKAFARIVDQFLRRPAAHQAARQAIAANDDAKLLQYALEALRFNPQNHVLARWCEKLHVLAEGTPRATQIPANSLVFAATLSAMFDKDKVKNPDPEEFSPGRPDDNYLFFGYQRHECLGRYISPVLIREVLKRVLILKSLRRAKTDQFNPLDVLPLHFMLEFDA